MTLELENDNAAERWDELREIIEDWQLEHFAAREFVRLRWEILDADQIDGPVPDAGIPYPWHYRDLVHTATLADKIRADWGAPVKVVSGYRPPTYNDVQVEGSERSMHVRFAALDLQPVDDYEIHEWIAHCERIVEQRRQDAHDAIGLGRYWDERGSFVHLDTGYHQHDRDWHVSEHGYLDPRTQ